MRNTESLNTSLAVTAQRTQHSPGGLFLSLPICLHQPSVDAIYCLRHTMYDLFYATLYLKLLNLEPHTDQILQ